MMMVIRSSETSVLTRATRHKILEDGFLQIILMFAGLMGISKSVVELGLVVLNLGVQKDLRGTNWVLYPRRRHSS
jgi:hypothetical protein